MDSHTHRSFDRLEIVEMRRRRRWSDAEKLKIVLESLAGPREVSATARRHGISRSQLVTWRRAFRAERIVSEAGPTFVPAMLAPPPELPKRARRTSASRMEIVLVCGRRIVVEADVDAEALARVIAVLDRP